MINLQLSWGSVDAYAWTSWIMASSVVMFETSQTQSDTPSLNPEPPGLSSAMIATYTNVIIVNLSAFKAYEFVFLRTLSMKNAG